MANFSKSFNFRGGFQVDTDVLLVRGQKVGIGSTIPEERLDVNGIIKCEGLRLSGEQETVIRKATAGVLTVTDYLDVGIETGSSLFYPEGTPQVRITTGIITAANPAIGVVTYYGDGGRLLNLPTSQWLDIDVGLGFTSIYAQGFVGVDTTDPRYVFQVGGAPFNPGIGSDNIGFQTGVGIADGEIFASGIITSGTNISAASTVYAGAEFIGVGSNISILNADNIAIGSIGSMRYGDLIVTKEVIADNFTGIASTAVSVLPDSQLVFDTARADKITAISRFISTEGKIAIGHNDFPNTNSSIGDIDVRREAGDSYIYSLASDADTAKILVGNEREGGGRNKFGGLRFGGNVPGSSLSGRNDVDLANYDVGNINFYLHDGNVAGGTQGEWRWIYGQLETVPMTLTPLGKLILSGNIASGENTLEVTGVSTLTGNAFVGEDFSVAGNATFKGDVNVEGTLAFDNVSVGGTITVPTVIFEDEVIVGADPSLGTDGVILRADGTAEISKELIVESTIINDNGISLSNNNTVSAPIGSFTLVSATNANLSNITSPGFTVNNSEVTIDTLNLGTINVATITIPIINTTTLNVTTVNALGIVNCESLIATSVNADDLNITGIVSFTSDVLAPNFVAGNAEINSIQSNTIGGIGGGDLAVGSDLTSLYDIETTAKVRAGEVETDDLVVSNRAEIAALKVSGGNLTFSVDTLSEEITITITDDNGDPIGTAAIEYRVPGV